MNMVYLNHRFTIVQILNITEIGINSANNLLSREKLLPYNFTFSRIIEEIIVTNI